MREPREHVDDDAGPVLPLERAAVAELLGSFTVVLFSAGSAIVAGSVGGGLVGVALAAGFAFAAALAATMPLSAGGVNPVVTAGLWVAGRLSTPRAVVYVAAQIVGGIVAGLALRVTIPQESWRASALGAPLLAEGVGAGSAVLVEGLGAFVLTTLAFAMFVDARSRSASFGALVLGLFLTAATLFAWPLTGAALNPARAIGPELAGGTWTDWWVYWLGPAAGAVVAGVAYSSLFLREPPPPDA